MYVYLYIYILFYILFYWCIPLDHEIYTKCKKTSNLLKGVSSGNICSGNKIQQVKKTICHSVPKNFNFFQNSSVLMDKPNERCQIFKKIKRNAISTTKKSFYKEKEIVLHQQKQMPLFHKLLQNA